MLRHSITPRNNWQAAVEKHGFGFHTTDVPYWDESAYYEFTEKEILQLETATALLWDMCLGAVQHVMDNNLYHLFAIPEKYIPFIEKSWLLDHPAIYGRFDLGYNDRTGSIKLLEFNADTPTSLYEAGIVQWFWLQDFASNKDQFNSIHEKLIDYWRYLKNYLHKGEPVHFACLKQTLEDLTNTEYLRDCAIQGGLDTNLIFVDDIGWNEDEKSFVDLRNRTIKNIFKLYPWEFMISVDAFSEHLLNDVNNTFWIEPPWKMILSNKAILPILHRLYPGNEFILPAYFEHEEHNLKSYVRKPILSREGANISIMDDGKEIEFTSGEYGKEGFIIQEKFDLPSYDGNYPILGSWIIGQQPSGMGIRESKNLITGNTSRFIPHLFNK